MSISSTVRDVSVTAPPLCLCQTPLFEPPNLSAEVDLSHSSIVQIEFLPPLCSYLSYRGWCQISGLLLKLIPCQRSFYTLPFVRIYDGSCFVAWYIHFCSVAGHLVLKELYNSGLLHILCSACVWLLVCKCHMETGFLIELNRIYFKHFCCCYFEFRTTAQLEVWYCFYITVQLTRYFFKYLFLHWQH